MGISLLISTRLTPKCFCDKRWLIRTAWEGSFSDSKPWTKQDSQQFQLHKAQHLMFCKEAVMRAVMVRVATMAAHPARVWQPWPEGFAWPVDEHQFCFREAYASLNKTRACCVLESRPLQESGHGVQLWAVWQHLAQRNSAGGGSWGTARWETCHWRWSLVSRLLQIVLFT